MSAIQNIKNFIRHGKQAKFANAGEPTTNVTAVHAQPQNAGALGEPNFGEATIQGVPHDEYSAAAIDNRNVAAQAADVAAHAAGKHQRRGDGKYDAEAIEALIAEERASKGKMPNYPGLERWALLEKMGDGAFSNVYRAQDREGQYDQVAIKVVRKFEMNNTQVRHISISPPDTCLSFIVRSWYIVVPLSLVPSPSLVLLSAANIGSYATGQTFSQA
jgi:serine/threonine-protein kinase RCK2